MASRNEASIWVSSAPKAARNTARSSCSLDKEPRCSNLSASASASSIASRASKVRPARCNASAVAKGQMASPAPHRLPDSLLFPARSTEYPPRYHRMRCAPNRGESILPLASTQNCNALTIQSFYMANSFHLARTPKLRLAHHKRPAPHFVGSLYIYSVSLLIRRAGRGDRILRSSYRQLKS